MRHYAEPNTNLRFRKISLLLNFDRCVSVYRVLHPSIARKYSSGHKEVQIG
jgi:hypothetical protein